MSTFCNLELWYIEECCDIFLLVVQSDLTSMWFPGSPGTPSSSPPLAGGALQSPASSVAHPHHRNNSGNGGHPGGKLPDENSNIQPQVDRHDSISPASMDSSIQDEERVAKSKCIFYSVSISKGL